MMFCHVIFVKGEVSGECYHPKLAKPMERPIEHWIRNFVALAVELCCRNKKALRAFTDHQVLRLFKDAVGHIVELQ